MPVRSENDGKLINNLRMKVYVDDLIKAEKYLLNAQTKLAKLAYQLKQKYDKEDGFYFLGGWFCGNLASHPYFTRSKGSIAMTSETHLPIINPSEDSPVSVIPVSESATAEENRVLHCRIMEIWDAWSNGKEPPSAIPGFPELLPRSSGTTNVPILVTNPFIPFGYPTMSANFTGMPSDVHPQAPFLPLPKISPNGPVASCTSKQIEPESPSYNPGTRCAYHSGAEGYDTEDYWTLKRAVENLIEQKRVVLRDEEVPNVTKNPLPAHNNGPVIGMIYEDKEFYPELKAIIAITDAEKKPKTMAKQVRNEKKINSTPQNAENVAETKIGAAPAEDVILYVPRTPRKGQLMLKPPKRFEQKKATLTMPRIYVPKGTYVMRRPIILPGLDEPLVISCAPQNPMRDPIVVPWNYNKTVVTYKVKEVMGEINETNQSRKYHNPEELNKTKQKQFPLKNRNDLPPEGAAHNKTLHLTIKCEGYYVKRVMLDGGSGVDIFHVSTLQRMEIGTERIRPNNVCVRAFDDVKRDMIGEIDLVLTIRPVDFEVTFQVLDMDTYCNFLLGRPWIHVAGAVPSTLHQIVKLEHENQKIVVHREDEQSIYRDPLAPCLEAREDVFAWSYDDMSGLSLDLVVHKLPTYLGYPPIQQKQRKFKTKSVIRSKKKSSNS
ncbi:uncharacterized protein [Nicotiana sylvestris]|uniref:uncharacterized protein n=1 Tax=Nicotiana sylvestris TaxID=4096 RepID=UPI00388CA9E6